MGTAQDMELHVSALRKDWYYLHRVNLVSIMYELLQRRNFKMLSRVTTALLNTYSHLKAVFCDEGGSKTKWAVLQQVLRYGLETMLKASNTLEDEKVQKYMAALRNMKGIFAFRDREAFDLDLGFFHLRRRNVMMAYETLNAMSKRRLAGVAGRKSSKLLYQRSLSCGLIRHTQWLEAIKRDAERISASGHPLDFAAELWGFDFFLWQRAGRDMIDFWTEAVKHLKEALSHRPGCTVAASVLVHLELAGGHRADALAVARGLAEAVPHSPDALALLCLLARSRPPGRADSGRGLPAGDDERPGPRASEDGAEDLRGETAHDEGARVAELCRLHLELLRQMPESHEAFEGLWSLRESLSPSALLEGVLEHMDALGGGCAIPPSRWQQLLQALESPSVTALADSQDSEGLGELQRIDDMLQERRGWWGRCHFWSPPSWGSGSDEGGQLLDKLRCAVHVLGEDHEWCKLTKGIAVADSDDAGLVSRSSDLADRLRRVAAAGRTPPEGGLGALSAGSCYRRLPASWWLCFPEYRSKSRRLE